MKNAVIYIDVDLTLIDFNRNVIEGAVDMVKKLYSEDTELYLWSTAGKDYCESVAKRLEIYELFNGFMKKPDIVIDDMPQTGLNPFIFNPNDFNDLNTLTKKLVEKHLK